MLKTSFEKNRLMQYPQIDIAPSNEFYFVWTEKDCLFVKNGITTQNALEKTKHYYKTTVDKTVEDWKLLVLGLTIKEAPRNVVDFFIKEIHQNLKEKDLFFATRTYNYKDSKDKQILCDILHSVNENFEEGFIKFNENANNSLSAINQFGFESTLMSEFTNNKKHKKIGKLKSSLSTQLIKSYIASKDGITFQLIDNSYVAIGYGDYSYDYEFFLEKYL